MKKTNDILAIARNTKSMATIPESFATLCSVVLGRFCIEYGEEEGVVPIEWLCELKSRINISPELLDAILSWLQERGLMSISEEGSHILYGCGEEAEMQLQKDIIAKDFFSKYEDLLDSDLEDDEIERRGAALSEEAKKKLHRIVPNADLSIFDLDDSEES